MRTVTISNVEAIPLIFSLIESGRAEIAYRQLENMARKADAFGKDLEIVLLPEGDHYQVLLVAVGMADPILIKEPLPWLEAYLYIEELREAYPTARVR